MCEIANAQLMFDAVADATRRRILALLVDRATFAGVVAVGMVIVGHVFNAVP